jgi:hypothetical protein
MRKIRFFQQSGYISLDLAAGRGEFLRLRPGSALALGAGAGRSRPHRGHHRARAARRVTASNRCASNWSISSRPCAATVRSWSAGEDGRAALAVALEIVDRIEHHVAHRNPARS